MKKQNSFKITTLLLIDWFAELICFIAIVLSLGLALIILFNDVLSISLNKVHIFSLLLLYFLVIVGVLISSKMRNVVISARYYHILSIVCLISLFSFQDYGILDYFRLHIQDFSFMIMGILLLMIVLVRQYPKVMHKELYKKDYQIMFPSTLEEPEDIKKTMLSELQQALKDKYKDSVLIVGKSFLQDNNGNVKGIFKVILNKKIFNIAKPKLIETTINFTKAKEN